MTDEQHRLAAGSGAAQPHHQIPLVRHRRENLHISGGKAGIAESRGYRFGSLCVIPNGIRRVDFDELLQDLAGFMHR